MALPTTVVSGADATLGGHHPPFKASDGDFFIIAKTNSTSIDAYKASDPTSSWSAVDTANNPTFSAVDDLWVVQNGDNLYVATFDGTDLTVEYHKFDMSAETWSVTNSVVEDVSGMFAPVQFNCSIAYRSGVTSAELVIAYSGLRDNVMGNDYGRVDFRSADDVSSPTWSSTVALDDAGEDHYRHPHLVLGASNKVHALWKIQTAANPDTEAKTIQTNDTLSSLVTNTAATLTDSFTNIIFYDDAGTDRLKGLWCSGGTQNEIRGTFSSDDINALTNSADSSFAITVSSFEAAGLANNGNEFWLVYSDDSDKDLKFRTQTGNGSWSSATVIATGTFTGGVHANFYSRGGSDKIGVICYDGTDTLYNEVDLGGAQTITCTGIASAEAFGTAQLNQEIDPVTAIASSEAFGTAQVNQEVDTPAGITSAEAHGTAQVNLQIDPTGIASAEAHGTATIQYDQSITATGIASAEAFGAAQVNLQIDCTGIASAEAHGTAQLNLQIDCTGMASAEAFGNAAVQLNQQITAAGNIASAEAFGTSSVNLEIDCTGIASAEAHGTGQLNLQIDCTGIASAEGFGSHTVSTPENQTITATGIASAEAFGTAQINLQIDTPAGIASAEAHGTPQLDLQIQATPANAGETFGLANTNQQIDTPAGIASAEAHGTGQLNLQIDASSIPSAEAFGAPQVHQQILAASANAGEQMGTPDITFGAQIEAPSIASGERFGWVEVLEKIPNWLVLGDPITKPVGEKDVQILDYTPWLNGESIAAAVAEVEPGIDGIVVKQPIVTGNRVEIPYEIVQRVSRDAHILATVRSDNPHRKSSRRAFRIKTI